MELFAESTAYKLESSYRIALGLLKSDSLPLPLRDPLYASTLPGMVRTSKESSENSSFLMVFSQPVINKLVP